MELTALEGAGDGDLHGGGLAVGTWKNDTMLTLYGVVMVSLRCEVVEGRRARSNSRASQDEQRDQTLRRVSLQLDSKLSYRMSGRMFYSHHIVHSRFPLFCTVNLCRLLQVPTASGASSPLPTHSFHSRTHSRACPTLPHHLTTLQQPRKPTVPLTKLPLPLPTNLFSANSSGPRGLKLLVTIGEEREKMGTFLMTSR